MNKKKLINLNEVVIRFVGDSGDGMQLVGTEFGKSVASLGNDISTLPDYPSEIRAPAGTIAGVSGFQIQFASHEIFTPGDEPNVLVAMNPAALKVNVKTLKKGGILIVNIGNFTKSNINKAGYTTDPLLDESLSSFNIIKVDINSLARESLKNLNLTKKEIDRSKNFWALGLVYWMYSQPLEKQIENITLKFKNEKIRETNILVFKAGYLFGENTEQIQYNYCVNSAKLKKGKYRTITGNYATALGLAIGSNLTGLEVFLGSYPITPASDILHHLSGWKQYNVTTFQAEDEIAAIGAAIGAGYGGALSVTTTSGPGLALKGEALGLAVMLEIPLIVVNVQRGGPSTGLPTKVEQSDYFLAMYGRSGESEIPIVAPKSPSDCFFAVIEAIRIAIKYMTPVLILTDSFIANSSEPWKIPNLDEIKKCKVTFEKPEQPFLPYKRDEETLARKWIIPGIEGGEYRIGGLEKHKLTGEVCHDPENHEAMISLRKNKIKKITRELDNIAYDFHGDKEGDLLVIGWGGTFGAIRKAVKNKEEHKVGHLHLRWLNPLYHEIKNIMLKYKKILVCEINNGQIFHELSSHFLIKMDKYNKIKGQPFTVVEIEKEIDKYNMKG